MPRVSIHEVPATPRRCAYDRPCVYRESGICDEPAINKGNSDAACHRMNNKDLLPLLEKPNG